MIANNAEIAQHSWMKICIGMSNDGCNWFVFHEN